MNNRHTNLSRQPISAGRRTPRVLVVGAGVGGLVAAAQLAAAQFQVTVLDRAATAGGKLAAHSAGRRAIDAGPTVFAMRWVFDEFFDALGASFESALSLKRAETLARHAWSDDQRLDLYSDARRSADAIAAFANPAEARRYLDFRARAQKVYQSLEGPFLRSDRPSNPIALARRFGIRGAGDLLRIAPFDSLWNALGNHFRDARLRQLFGRYATYCGSSPFLAPATLMLVAHVEHDGVWLVDGGMSQIAYALEALGRRHGASFRFDADVAEVRIASGKVAGITLESGERMDADVVVLNGDVAALAGGCFGREAAAAVPRIPASSRSLSAITWTMLAERVTFPLLRHTVFFSGDYRREFDDLLGNGTLPIEPTLYVCAQDRDDSSGQQPDTPERLLVVMNAPAAGDQRRFGPLEIDLCENHVFGLLERCGLTLRPLPESTRITTPADFHRRFPGTGGALYGQASHGWQASFARPGSRTRIPGLYLAGGSTHPGPGVPMAALSGRLAASSVIADCASTRRSVAMATPGGMSTA